MNEHIQKIAQHATSSGYTWLDYSIMIIIILSVVVSFLRGFIREAVSLAIWAIAVFVSVRFATPLSELLAPYLSSAMVRYIIAFFALFLASMVLGVLINVMMRTVIEKAGMSATDRMLGVFFGAARGVLFVAVILMFASFTPLKTSTLVTQSKIAPHFKVMVDWLDGYLPAQVKHVTAWVDHEKAAQSVHKVAKFAKDATTTV